MRLIDADALIHHFYETEYASMYYIEVVKRIIDEQPTLSPDDVRGVGEWIRQEKSHPNCPEDSDYRYECSVCGWSDQHNAKMIVPFCWHCGARMKGTDA